MKGPQLLWIDEKAVNAEKINLIKAEDTLNKFIKAAEHILKTVTPEQREFIREQKMKYIESEIRKHFPFPNASAEFNYQSLGVDLNPLNNILKSGTAWDQYVFDQDKNGHFSPSENQPVYLRHYHYADTELKLTALAFARQFAAMLEVAQEKNFVDYMRLGEISLGLKGLLIVEHGKARNEGKLVINYKGISQI